MNLILQRLNMHYEYDKSWYGTFECYEKL